MACDLTCVVTGHREGRIAAATLRSFNAAVEDAQAAGRSVQKLFYLDRPDEITRAVFEHFVSPEDELRVVDFGDQGRTRNAAIDRAEGRYTAFLDGDDLWSADWLVQALAFLQDAPETHIAHPAFNYFFEGQATIYQHIDQEDPAFRLALLRVANYWDALCVCPTAIHREIPFGARDIANGWAFEDWFWNCETIVAGKIHKIVPDTVLFKRRRKSSQTIAASQNRSMIRMNALLRYDGAPYARP